MANRKPNREQNKKLGEWGTRYVKERLQDLGVCLETHDIASHDLRVNGIKIEVKTAQLRVDVYECDRWDFNFRQNKADYRICLCVESFKDQEVVRSVLIFGSNGFPSFVSVYRNHYFRTERTFEFEGDGAIKILKGIIEAKDDNE